MSELMANYARASLADLAPVSKERGDPTKAPESPYIGLEHIEKDTATLVDRGTAEEVKSTKSVFRKGDLLYGKLRPYLNKVWLAEFDGLCSTDILVFSQGDAIDNRFLKYRFLARDFVNYANANSSGVNLPRVNLKALGRFKVDLPPLPEQRRIVARIEELFSRLDAGVAALRHTQAQLQRYRQSVLAAAVTGQLTQSWREQNPDWKAAPFGELIESSFYGPRIAKANYSDEGVATIRTTDMTFEGAIKLTDAPRVKLTNAELEKYELRNGDLVITRTGATIGKCAVYSDAIGPAIPGAYLIRFRLKQSVLAPKYALLYLQSPIGQRLLSGGTSAVAQPNVNATTISKFEFRYPAIDEQNQIIVEVESRTTAIDYLEAELDRQITRATHLRQSILASAFSGQLVPQDPKDEPAIKLLERVSSTKQRPPRTKPPKHTQRSKPKREAPTSPKPPDPVKSEHALPPQEVIRVEAAPIKPPTMRQTRLIQLKLHKDYSSLKAGLFDLRSISEKPERLAPLCLVGLNGSGKSNLIEALSEILCHVELSLLDWKEIKQKQRDVRLGFDLEYQVFEKKSNGSFLVRLTNTAGGKPQFAIVRDGEEQIVEDREECLDLLPSRFIGYSSGLNETISIPYFRTASVYSDEVLKQAQREEKSKELLPDVRDSRALFMDYECNALVFVANYLLQPKSSLNLFRKHLRISGLESFEIRFRPTYQGKKPVKLTNELKRYISLMKKSATSSEKQSDGITEIYRFEDPDSSAQILKQSLGKAEVLFGVFYKLSLLNALELRGKERDFYLQEDLSSGQLERPPTVPRNRRVFSVENIKVKLTKPKTTIDYAGLSDGEHQFLQIFGGVLLFGQPGCVFLLDEPETHFNPQWRRMSVEWLANIRSSAHQELMISTHSPFVVSGCKGKNVFQFLRKGSKCECNPVDIETFGASYDFLLSRLFEMETMVAAEAIRLMKELIEDGSLDDLRAAIPLFGESIEKRFIFERIAELEKKNRKTR